MAKAWLSTKGHTLMTGSAARVSGKVGGRFTAWDGYISGRTLELEPDQRIVQAWRTTEFPDNAPDSHLEVSLEKVKRRTKVTISHSALPPGTASAYKQGWKDSYFAPMKTYFGK
ncbi:MAG TPA: SRPBCC domain-containing protein [Anaerolineales bacterium]|nr:SRPBCC domain-containing protein [Anaerolineales bacterium]